MSSQAQLTVHLCGGGGKNLPQLIISHYSSEQRAIRQHRHAGIQLVFSAHAIQNPLPREWCPTSWVDPPTFLNLMKIISTDWSTCQHDPDNPSEGLPFQEILYGLTLLIKTGHHMHFNHNLLKEHWNLESAFFSALSRNKIQCFS